ncbi:hypothetical protein D9M70_549900 [compost metagenome]
MPGAPPSRAGVERLPFQPDAHDPAPMNGQGAESGEALVEVGKAHGRRILLCPRERAVGEWSCSRIKERGRVPEQRMAATAPRPFTFMHNFFFCPPCR